MIFTPKTFDFLIENKINDSRVWFSEHKEEYDKYVLSPFKSLVERLGSTMLSIDNGLIIEPKVDKTISRIYRDTRYSNDKSIYRDVMWCVFMRNKKLYNGFPGYFFEISPRRIRYGCGYYQASTETMQSYRELIINNDKSFLSALKCFENQDVFELDGDIYKRSKAPELADNIRNWVDRKNICLIHTDLNVSLIFDDIFIDKLENDFVNIKPFYDFLCEVECHKYHKSEE